MSERPKFKLPAKKAKRQVITALKLEDGREVTDPEEINRLLRLNGFTVDPLTGAVGLTNDLRASTKRQ